MKYFHLNTELTEQIKQIKLLLTLQMNGVNSESISKKGIVYKKNYGLTAAQIKMIAGRFKANSTLARYLWSMQERETMLLASLLQPANDFNQDDAAIWTLSINNDELAQQCALNLFQKLAFAKILFVELIQNSQIYAKVCGFYTGAYIINQLTTEEKKYALELCFNQPIETNQAFAHAYSVFLRKIGRENKETADDILQKFAKFECSNNNYEQYIFQEIKLEFSFYFNS